VRRARYYSEPAIPPGHALAGAVGAPDGPAVPSARRDAANGGHCPILRPAYGLRFDTGAAGRAGPPYFGLPDRISGH
jgi:hypothetical protein